MTVGGKPPSGLGKEALLDFRMEVTLDGERLTAAEIAQLLAASDGLHLVRGRWVEVDRDKLSRMLDEFRAVEQAARETGLNFGEAMRLLAGANVSDAEPAHAAAPDWSHVAAGPWLAQTLQALRHPETLTTVDPGDLLTHVHLADAFDHTASSGNRYILNPPGTAARIHQHLDMGEGEVDFDELFRELHANGFDGTLTACVFAWEERAKESSLFMREKIAEYMALWS